MRKRLLQATALAGLACLVLGGVGIDAIHIIISRSVADYTLLARQHHPDAESDVAALIAYTQSDPPPLQQRNLAVWRLGRLGDAETLVPLTRLYTGTACAHGKFLCQYELTKAIRILGGRPSPGRDTGQ